MSQIEHTEWAKIVLEISDSLIMKRTYQQSF